MASDSAPMFRPSLVICIGKTGELIREHLTPYPGKASRMADGSISVYHLLANVDVPLRKSVGVLQVITEGNGADFDRAVPIPIEEEFPKDPDIPVEPGDLRETIRDALMSVQLDRRIVDIRTNGYNIPNTRTQIFIVGEENDRPGTNGETNMRVMAKVLKIVREVVKEYPFETPVFYFLNAPLKGDYYQTLLKPYDRAGLKWPNYHLTNFSYLFEPLIPFPSPAFLTPSEMQYAAAEALTAFIATGITALPELENETQIPPDLQDYSRQVGSVTTSMISFPHAAILRYTSNLLSADLMHEWRHSFENSDISDAERYALQMQARNVIGDMMGWMGDREERPGTEENMWPTLEILLRDNHPRSNERPRQRDALIRLREVTFELFNNFSEEDLQVAFKNSRGRSWSDLATDASNKAAGLFPSWERQARTTWDAASARLNAEIKRDADAYWERDDDGFERSKIFVDELDNRLGNIASSITTWRQNRHQAYKDDREKFRQKSEGEWNLAEDQPNIDGGDGGGGGVSPPTQQLKPTMSNRGLKVESQSGQSIIGLSSGGGSGGLPPNEDDIALGLERRVAFKQGLIPAISTLASTSFLGWITSVEILKIFPQLLSLQLPANLAMVVLVAAGSLLFYSRRSTELRQAKQDTLAFYRRYYADQCERREDLERTQLIRFIRGKVYQMRLRLDNLSLFFQSVEKKERDGAEQICEQVFDGPGGQRDILIASGERLQKTGRHTLQSVNQSVTQNRLSHPLQDWHRSLSTIKAQLIAQLRLEPESLLAMKEEEVRKHLSLFMSKIVDGYLTGSLVNISAALDKPIIWREVFERVSKPMYFARVGMRDPQWLFVCGSQTDLVKSAPYLPAHAIQVPTKSSEWLMVVALFKGGEPTKLDAEKMFPPITSP